MKIFTKKNTTQKIILAILIVTLCNFIFPTYSRAGWGGLLLDPIIDVAGSLLDIVVGGLQAFLVDGELNNSEDGGALNQFMENPDTLLENANGKYDDFQYKDGAGAPTEKIKESELDEQNILGWGGYFIPTLGYTPDKIFANLIPALDINFINPKSWDTEEEESRSVALELHNVISEWYVNLRNLAVVGLMLVLAYTGIRIVLSSTSSDRAKYKQMLADWLIAMCLLFCLHYIMTFTVTIIEQISGALNGAIDQNGNNITVAVVTDDNGSPATTSGGKEVKFSTDLMGLIRFKMQSNNGYNKLLYLIFYAAMVIYTCLFTFYYLKRVLTIAFLTLIAPLVALTYPIDKFKDGKAQAFDMWLKEYVFNALLQPFHLIIYTIFVSSAIELSAKNPIFAIVALAFIIPSEKLLRKFFGFDKASTASNLGGLAGVAGGAAAMNLAKRMLSPKGGKSAGGGKSGVRTRKTPDADIPALADSGIGRNGNAIVDNNEPVQTEPQLASDTGTNLNTNNRNETVPGNQTVEENNNPQLEDWDNNDMYLHPENYTSSFTPQETTMPGATMTNVATSSNNEKSSNNENKQNVFEKAFKWNENDSRGVLQWAGDGVKTIGGEVGGKLAGTTIGQNAIKFGRTVGDGAKSVKNMADSQIRKIPKPIRNTAKGTFNVAKKATIGTAKTVAKAAPGAVFGMAAGIVGDDLGDIVKYTAAGAAISSAALTRTVGPMREAVTEAYREGAFGSDALIEQARKDYINNTEYDAVYQHEFGPNLSKSQLKAKKEQGAYYSTRGIGGDDAIKAVKLEDKLRKELGTVEEGMDPQGYIASIMKEAKNYDKKDLRDETKVKGLTSSFQKALEKGGYSSKEASKEAERAVKYVKAAKGIKE